jgi:hypothetical protein
MQCECVIDIVKHDLNPLTNFGLAAGQTDQARGSLGPSSSSICTTLYGMSSLNAGNHALWTMVQLVTRPRPVARRQVMRSERQ